MPLKGKSPKAVTKRLKVLIWGESGSGKSFSCCQFPNVYFIDTEAGSENEQYVEALLASGSSYCAATTHDEVMAELRALNTEEHEHRTVVIDPITDIYNGLVDRFRPPEGKKGSFSGEYLKAATHTRRMLNLIFGLDMNVIVTAHAKTKWGRHGGELIDQGPTFNAWKDMGYAFDLVLQIYIGGDKVTRFAKVKKTRIESFQFDEEFEFSYQELSDRFGGDMMAKAKVQKAATADQVKQIETILASGVTMPEGWEALCFTKAGVNEWSEMTEAKIQKCIEAVQKKLEGKK